MNSVAEKSLSSSLLTYHDWLEASDPQRIVVDKMLQFMRERPDSFSRSCEIGHFTSSAVILREDGILLNFHEKLDRWLQLGGHIETDESATDAALREGVEESGYPHLALVRWLDNQAIPFDLDIHRIPANRKEAEHLHYDVRYLVRMRNSAADLSPTNLKWFRWDELSNWEEESLRRIAQKAETIRKKLQIN